MKTYTINHIATSTPSYFCGSYNQVVQVPVISTTTYGDIKEYMLDDYYATAHIEDLDVEAYKLAVEELFKQVDLAAIFDNSIEDVPEDSCYEDVYMFFELIEEEDTLNPIIQQQIAYAKASVTVTKDKLGIEIQDRTTRENIYLHSQEAEEFLVEAEDMFNRLGNISREDTYYLLAYPYCDLF